jgi:hypothetical protein
MLGFSPYCIMLFINWKEVYKLICKIDMSTQNKRTTQIHRKMMEIMREAKNNYIFT